MTDHRSTRTAGRDRGSSLLLIPVGVLLVLMLSAIAVDFSRVFLAQRSAQRAADVAADDAAGFVDIDHYRATGELRLRGHDAEQFVREQLARSSASPYLVEGPTVRTGREWVTITVTVEVEHPIGAIVPGGLTPSRSTLTARAVMEPR